MSVPVAGVVEFVDPRGNAFMIGGERYSAFKSASLSGAQPGDRVSFLYDEKAGSGVHEGKVFRNIRGSVSIVEKASGPSTTVAPKLSETKMAPKYRGGFPVPPDDYQRAIIRQNAVTNAIAFLELAPPKKEDPSVLIENVLRIAKAIEKYTSGDADRETVEAITASMSVPHPSVRVLEGHPILGKALV